MDIFDQYLFEELTTQYSKSGLSTDDYEELYMRFCNMDHLKETKPYIMAMRFYGLGTPSEKEQVLSELHLMLDTNDCLLNGLYYDLLLTQNRNNSEAKKKLDSMVQKGYISKFTKEHTNITEDTQSIAKSSEHVVSPNETLDETVEIESISFEWRDKLSGYYFTGGDVDYLNAFIYIKPIKGKKHIKVCSQMFFKGSPFSAEYFDEFDIDASTTWLRTQGLGDNNCSCYITNTYTWVVSIDGGKKYSQDFYMYSGKLDKWGPKVKSVKVFSGKFSGLREQDSMNYATAFDRNTLECIYFKFFIECVGKTMNLQVFMKVTCLEDGTVFRDTYTIHQIQSDTTNFWCGVGCPTPGQWKSGLYQYSVYIGDGPKFEGTISVW